MLLNAFKWRSMGLGPISHPPGCVSLWAYPSIVPARFILPFQK